LSHFRELLKTWHPSNNVGLNPNDIPSTSSLKVWWKCNNGHSWEATVRDRKSGRGCPYCSNKKVCIDNCLATLNPTLAEEWHTDKNGDFTPYDVTPKSDKKAWWMCQLGHTWEAQVKHRSNGTGCPYCDGKKVSIENCLETNFPKIAIEWHPTKNKGLTPKDVTAKTDKKVWWLCPKKHEYFSSISKRTVSRRGCPTCSSAWKTSIREQSVFYYLRQVFTDVENRAEIQSEKKKFEMDIYIPSLKLAVEYDGHHHAKSKVITHDEKKNQILQENGIQLIRIRQSELPKIRPFGSHVIKTDNKSLDFLKESIDKMFDFIVYQYTLNPDLVSKIEQARKLDINEHQYNIMDQIYRVELGKSLVSVNLEAAKDWHPTKNGNLLPSHVSPASNKVVWWQCTKGHEWTATIDARHLRNNACPECTLESNCLGNKYPDLIKEWDEEKNGKLTPYQFSYGSTKVVWWKCLKNHSWQEQPQLRIRGLGCPFCAGKRVNLDNCLATVNPELAKEWHAEKNGRLTPFDVTKSSGKVVWWLCSKKGHEWEARIASRNKGNGCPFCAGKRVFKDNCLETEDPILASQWHPTRNTKTPNEVTAHYGKKVWWYCENGHEWEATVDKRYRAKTRKCPVCMGWRNK
jgi:hypothetical protein